jgi:peptidoglycan hydrolase-like protein with peptidoglycan-binding domain
VRSMREVMESGMRTLILATVSAIALGIAGAGPLYAQNANNAPAAPSAANSPVGAPPSSTAPPAAAAPAQPTMPEANANANSEQTPSMAGNESSGAEWHGRLSRDEIKQLQSNLKQDGLYRGNIDGIDGPETHQALRAYQQQNGLRATGRLDQQTVASLLAAGNATGSSTPPNNSNSMNNGMNMPSSSNAGSNGANNEPASNNNHP